MAVCAAFFRSSSTCWRLKWKFIWDSPGANTWFLVPLSREVKTAIFTSFRKRTYIVEISFKGEHSQRILPQKCKFDFIWTSITQLFQTGIQDLVTFTQWRILQSNKGGRGQNYIKHTGGADRKNWFSSQTITYWGGIQFMKKSGRSFSAAIKWRKKTLKTNKLQFLLVTKQLIIKNASALMVGSD